jgi:hypothetical protein
MIEHMLLCVARLTNGQANAQAAQCKPCLLEIVPVSAVERTIVCYAMQPARAQELNPKRTDCAAPSNDRAKKNPMRDHRTAMQMQLVLAASRDLRKDTLVFNLQIWF